MNTEKGKGKNIGKKIAEMKATKIIETTIDKIGSIETTPIRVKASTREKVIGRKDTNDGKIRKGRMNTQGKNPL